MIQDTLDQVVTAITYATWENKQEILRRYAESVVEECAGKLSDDGAIQEGWLYNKILKVKQQIT